MTWSLVPLADFTPQAWRNGGGITRELLAWPARDFNLMAPPGKGELRSVRGSQAVSTNAPALVAVDAHAHGAHVIFGSEAIDVPAAHLAWRLQEGSLNGAVHGPDALGAEVLR